MSKRIIIKLSGLLVLFIFTVLTLSFTSIERKTLTCKDVEVVFKDDFQFVTQDEIRRIVEGKFKSFAGSLLDTINTNAIEAEIEKNPWVKRAEVFKGFAKPDSMQFLGSVKVKITQETPRFRVVHGADVFYMNDQGKKMPFSSTNTANVLVVTGYTPDPFIQKELLQYIKFIDSNEFWKAQIQQIHVLDNVEVILIPRVGDHKIEIGNIRKVEEKFRNLKAV